ncbi:MAG: pilus assembly protein PilP [Gammaproteobacteria bacterium]
MKTCKSKTGRVHGVATLVAMALLLPACSYDAADLRDYVAEVKSRPGGKIGDIPPPPQAPPVPEVSGELERYSLDSLRMVGTLDQQSELWALIRDPGGVIHRVKAGHYMGSNYGKILEVSERRIYLLEKVSDRHGQWQEREAEVSLYE